MIRAFPSRAEFIPLSVERIEIRFTLAALAVACMLLYSNAYAQPSPALPRPPEILAVEVGLSGHYKAGHWTAVRVTLRGGSEPVRGQLSVTVPDGDGVPSRVAEPIALEPDRDTTAMLSARFGRLDSQMDVELRAGEEVVANKAFRSSSTPAADGYSPALPSTFRLIATLASDSAGVEQAMGVLREESDEKTVAFQLDSASPLPTRWYGLESLDTLVLSTSDPDTYASLKPDGPEIEALDQWVRMGGKLLIALGSQAESVLAEGAPLARFVPGRLQRTVVLRQTGALEAYAGGAVPVPRGPGGRLEFRAPQLDAVQGVVEAREGNLPLVIRSARGLGQVIFLAADLDASPLRSWPDRGLLVARLLDWTPEPGDELREGSALMHYGFTDMSGQLRRALDQYRGVAPFSLWIVAAPVGAYLLLIGPVDYFLLRRFSPRMEFTWITFPLIVIGFSAGAYLLGHRFKGREVRVNQVTLVDVDAESKQLRGTWWAGMFSPRMDRYDLSLLPPGESNKLPRADSTVFSWLGLPGHALGGMDPVAATPVNVRQPYAFSPQLDAISEIPIQVWATKSLTARWHGPAAAVPDTRLADEDGVPVGTVVNTLDFPLEDCLLAYGRWAYQLGTLEPGQAARVGPMIPRRELRTLLTGRKLVRDETDKFQQESTPYDPSSVDPAYILRTMMFFDMAGGRRYTGLMNRYQEFVDLSGLLKTNRAILVGSVPSTSVAKCGATLSVHGEPVAGPQDRQWAVYRFVLPVQQDREGQKKVPLFRDEDKP